jgi:hypothetical protein
MAQIGTTHMMLSLALPTAKLINKIPEYACSMVGKSNCIMNVSLTVLLSFLIPWLQHLTMSYNSLLPRSSY